MDQSLPDWMSAPDLVTMESSLYRTSVSPSGKVPTGTELGDASVFTRLAHLWSVQEAGPSPTLNYKVWFQPSGNSQDTGELNQQEGSRV